MDPLFLPDSGANSMEHLQRYAPPGEKARNQLILIGSVFAVALALRLWGLGWFGTIAGGAGGGLLVGMVVLEVWERVTGRRSARRPTQDRYTPAVAALMVGLDDEAAPGATAVSGEADDVRWIVSVRTDLAKPAAPHTLTPMSPKPAPIPLLGTRYAPQNGVVAVLPGAWLRLEARVGADPIPAQPADHWGEAADVIDNLGDDGDATLDQSGQRRSMVRALRFNQPWPHHLRVWPAAVVLTLPYTSAVTIDRVQRLVGCLARWQAARPPVKP